MRLSCFALLGCLLLTGAATLHAAPRNVVLLVTDDQSPDAGCYGNEVIQTPNMDRLAADGTRMDFAFCTTASCSASRSVILTGLFNHANGHYGHEHAYHKFSSYDHIRSLPVLLARGGYRTARIGKYHVAPEAVYHFDEALPGGARSPVQMADNCREFVSQESDKPFFLYFCTSDPHRGGGRAKELPQEPDRFGNKPAGQTYPGVKPVTYRPEDVIVPPFLPETPACRAELAQYYQSVSRIDQGLGRLMEILEKAGVWDETLFIYISDHGIAMPGGKTTVYEPGLHSPCLVRNPYNEKRGLACDAMVSWVDLTPTILDFAGLLDAGSGGNQPASGKRTKKQAGLPKFHGRSFLPVLDREHAEGWDRIYASHTFHEITMYYPMRVVRDRRFKLIWNIAHQLPYPFASDLWVAPTWQTQYQQGMNAMYGRRTVGQYIHRPRFELFDLEADPHEAHNLADDPAHAEKLAELQAELKAFQKRTGDPWILKWNYE